MPRPKTQTPEEARKRQTEYMKRYRAEHPNYDHDTRIQCAINLLSREGYMVIRQEEVEDTLVTMAYHDSKSVVRVDKLGKGGESHE